MLVYRKYYLYHTLVVLVLLCYCDLTVSQCPGFLGLGVGNFEAAINSADTQTTSTYISYDADEEVAAGCCGYITEIRLRVSGTGTIHFHVWEDTATADSYTLNSVHTFTVTDDSVDQTVTLTGADQLPIAPGYKFGWQSPDSVMVQQKGANTNTMNLKALGTVTAGTNVDWSAPDSTIQNTYGYGMSVTDGGGDPVINRPTTGTTISVLDSTAVTTTVFTASWTDPDTLDIPDLVIVMATNTYFQFDDTTGEISVKSSLASAPTTGITLTFTVTDRCDKTDTETLVVNVVNVPPTFNNLPYDTEISEDTTVETLLYTIDVTDTVDTVTCSLQSTDPAGGPFRVESDFGIYLNGNPGLSYDTQFRHILNVRCSDGDDNVDSVFTVYLTRNEAPVITNLAASVTVSANDPVGFNVFTVASTDAEGDSLTYSLSCDTATCPFSILNSGLITLDTDLSSLTDVGYDVSVTVNDGTSTTGPRVLSVKVSDINDPPGITNLVTGTIISVTENTPSGSSIFDVECTDNNVPATQTLTYTMTSGTASAATYFTMNSATGLISTASTVTDYEVLSLASTLSFEFLVTCSDGATSATVTFTISITNLNEAPTFNQAGYSLTSSEGTAGTVLGIPGFGVTDQDNGDTQRFTHNCGADTGYFLMASGNGQVSLLSNYDLDSGTRSTTVVCTVTVTDSGDLTGTTSLTLYLGYVNDHNPIFSPTSYSFFAPEGAAIGTSVGTVTATDADLGTHGQLTYTLDQSSLTSSYFGIDSTGLIFVNEALTSLSPGDTLTMSAQATDAAGTVSTAIISIVISATTTVVTTTTTDRYLTFFEDKRNIAWFTACIILIAVIVATVIWLIFAGHITIAKDLCSCCFKQKKRKPRKIKRRPSPPPSPRPEPRPRLPTPLPPPTPPTPRELPQTPRQELFDFWRDGNITRDPGI